MEASVRQQELSAKYRAGTISDGERREYAKILAEDGLRLHAALRAKVEPLLRPTDRDLRFVLN
jgi:hypothetical protein